MMKDDLSRYACQISLPGFGITMQQKLLNARILIVGLGGLGCPSAQYLTAAGIGNIGLADYDLVSKSNLHRQILFNESDIGQFKTDVAIKRLSAQNPNISLKGFTFRVEAENVIGLISDYDIIIDATDNFETRYLLNDACVLLGKPLVYGAIYQYEGQMAVWNIRNSDGTFSPNYRDVFAEVDASQIPNCAEGGVIPTIAGVIGCLQANAVISYLSGQSQDLAGQLFILNVQTLQSRKIHIGNISKVTVKEIKEVEKIITISVTELKIGMNNDAYELIDVRNIDERREFNIGGNHIPVASIEEEIQKVNTSKPVVFYCSSGKRSALAAKIALSKKPSLKVYSLDGGLNNWESPYPPKV